jgi:hypothetical protein
MSKIDVNTITLAEWRAKAAELFGPCNLDWRFICPSCGHVASVQDWEDADAPATAAAFSCVGRWSGAAREAFGKGDGPCNYAGGGLFRLNPVAVVDPDGHVMHVFAFAEPGIRPRTRWRMIDQYNEDRTGWARFSDDMTMRYHLGRLVSARASGLGGEVVWREVVWQALQSGSPAPYGLEIACFLLLNPSDATAFKPDPTVTECVKFTRRWGHDITWVVNQHAFRSPYPTDLKKRACGARGDDAVNAGAILQACRHAGIVIAGWGNDGTLDRRDVAVRRLLAEQGVKLHHLGMTIFDNPKHPLARGKHRIPADQQPIPWSTT